ncbi:MAG: hypothetical protein WCB71_14290 [Aestuariivirga sp.]
MLRPDIVDAAREKKFHIYAVSTIDEGIILLMGLEAGVRVADGKFPDGTINARVEAKLSQFSEMRKSFARTALESAGEEKERS